MHGSSARNLARRWGLTASGWNDSSPERVPVSLENSLRRAAHGSHRRVSVSLRAQAGRGGRSGGASGKAKRQGKSQVTESPTNDLKHVEYLHSLGVLDVVQYAKT